MTEGDIHICVGHRVLDSVTSFVHRTRLLFGEVGRNPEGGAEQDFLLQTPCERLEPDEPRMIVPLGHVLWRQQNGFDPEKSGHPNAFPDFRDRHLCSVHSAESVDSAHRLQSWL